MSADDCLASRTFQPCHCTVLFCDSHQPRVNFVRVSLVTEAKGTLGKTLVLKTRADDERVDGFRDYYRPYELTSLDEVYSFHVPNSARWKYSLDTRCSQLLTPWKSVLLTPKIFLLIVHFAGWGIFGMIWSCGPLTDRRFWSLGPLDQNLGSTQFFVAHSLAKFTSQPMPELTFNNVLFLLQGFHAQILIVLQSFHSENTARQTSRGVRVCSVAFPTGACFLNWFLWIGLLFCVFSVFSLVLNNR